MRRLSRGFWCTKPQSERCSARSAGGGHGVQVVRLPVRVAVGDGAGVGAQRGRTRTLSRVVLPEPDSPTMARTSPGQRSAATSSSAGMGPKRRREVRARRAGSRLRRSFRPLSRGTWLGAGCHRALAAVIGVGADEHAGALVVGDDLVEVAVVASRTARRRAGRGGAGTGGRRSRASGPRCRAGWRRCASRGRRRTAAARACGRAWGCRRPGSARATSGSGRSP